MHRWRTVAGLVVALLCILLAAQITQAQQTEPSGEKVMKKGADPGDDEVVVKPKGGRDKDKDDECKDRIGFGWIDKKAQKCLEAGEKDEFRCSLYENLNDLKALNPKTGKLEDAEIIEFNLEGKKFTVTKVSKGNELNKYKWDFVKVPCNKKCVDGGIPEAFMVGKAEGTIRAQFSSGWGENVKEVHMKGEACP